MGSGNGLSGCFACIKYLMFAFNFVFWLIGCALVGFGIWILVDDKFKELAADTEFAVLQYAGIGIIAVGCVIMVIGFFGCCGAIRESKCLLVMFFVCMFILFAGLITIGVLCFIGKDKFIAKITEKFAEEVETYDEKTSSTVNLIQETLECCGVEDYIVEYNTFIKNNEKVPISCPSQDGEPYVVAEGTKGCKEKAETFLSEYGLVLGGVTIGTGVSMAIGMIFSMLLCCAIRENYD